MPKEHKLQFQPTQTGNEAQKGKKSGEGNENGDSEYTSPSQHHDNDEDSSLSIASNIRKLIIEGKITNLATVKSNPSIDSGSQSQDVEISIDAVEEEGPNLNSTKIDRMQNGSRKRAGMRMNLCNG